MRILILEFVFFLQPFQLIVLIWEETQLLRFVINQETQELQR